MDTTNLDQQVSELGEAASQAANGRTARMLYGGPTSTLTQTVIAMREGSRLAEHESPGEATMLVLPTEVHAVEALTDAAFLLTAAKVRSA